MLSVVISIANHTLKNASSPEAFSEALVGRLHSMARAHGLLSRQNWAEAAVDELIRQEIEPYGLGRFEIGGPALRLKPQQGLSLGMVIHELATNAAKYGALSVPEGRVALEWTSNGKTMALKWREKKASPIDKVTSRLPDAGRASSRDREAQRRGSSERIAFYMAKLAGQGQSRPRSRAGGTIPRRRS